MRKTAHVGLQVGTTIILIFLQSCSLGIFRTAPVYDISEMLLEERLNGYLIRLVARREISDLEVLVNREYWLYITIAEATVDLDNLQSLKPEGLVEVIEVSSFESSVQIMLKLSQKIRYCDVLRDEKSNDILLALHLDWNVDG